MKRKLAYSLGILLFLILSTGIATPLLLYVGYRDLVSSKNAFTEGKIQEGTNLALSAKTKFAIIKGVTSMLRKADVTNVIAGLEEIANGLSLVGKASLLMQQTVSALLSGEMYKVNAISDASFALSDAKAHFDNAKLSLSSQDLNTTLLQNELQSMKADIAKLQQVVDTAKSLVAVFPKIAPVDGEKKYMLLFQNNMELRPTGGFIGSFAILGLHRGKLSEFTVYDVYDADGQLKGHVEPPTPIRKYLPQVNWFLRDSNWDIDFQQSAKSVEWFLEKELGISVDGAIGVDVTMAKLLLEATGPVYLTDYQENITKDTVFEKTHMYTQKDFFPGSRQKKDFLGSLMRSLRDKLASKDTSFLLLLASFQKGVKEKHMLFSFLDPSVQPIFTIHGWGGTLPQNNAIDKNEIDDFFAIREANLGVNKTNYFLKRSIEHTVSVQGEGIDASLTMIYDNKSQDKQEAIGGMYKNYLRTYLPQNAILRGITIDGEAMVVIPAEKNPLLYEKEDFFKNLGGRLELEQGEENGLLMVGFLLNIPAQSHKVVSLLYSLPKISLTDTKTFVYHLFISKQPGTDNDNLIVNVSYPNSFLVKTENTSTLIKDDKVAISSNLLKDQEYTLQFLQRE